ncbi:insect cuticle protein domain-containing protein [Phthorimaea operculella]|nr:insect cuticle protein domain-containing protein [Phthorimaea operculella]
MWRIVCLSLLSMSLWTSIWGQEYLPPKAGGKKNGEKSLPAMYDFAYDVNDNTVSLDFGHNEKRKDEKVTGSYHVLLPDGRMQLVEYEAGADGYKPQVMYMGTATYPAPNADKFDGYHYNAASNRHTHRRRSNPRAGVTPSCDDTNTYACGKRDANSESVAMIKEVGAILIVTLRR